jgi:hypothetical protein
MGSRITDAAAEVNSTLVWHKVLPAFMHGAEAGGFTPRSVHSISLGSRSHEKQTWRSADATGTALNDLAPVRCPRALAVGSDVGFVGPDVGFVGNDAQGVGGGLLLDGLPARLFRHFL